MTDTIVQPVLDVTLVNEDSSTVVYTTDEVNLVVVQEDDKIVVYEQISPVIIETAGIQGPAGPQGPVGPQGPAGGEDVPLAKQIDSIDDDHIYIGEALPGTALGASGWRIKYIVFTDVAGDDASITWAEGNDAYDKIWNNRLGYTYS